MPFGTQVLVPANSELVSMNPRRLLTGAGNSLILVLGLGVVVQVWTHSAAPERPLTTKALVDQLQSWDRDDRKNAVQELSNARADEVASVTPALIGALKDPEASVRNEAALAVAHYLAAALKFKGASLTEHARGAVAALVVVLERDTDLSVRASAAFAAAQLLVQLRIAGIKPDRLDADDPIDPRTMAKVLRGVLEREPATRLALLLQFEKLGPFDEPAPRVLYSALADPSRIVRIQALQAISQFSSGVDEAVPVLLKEAETNDLHAVPAPEFLAGQPLRQTAERLHPTPAVVPILVKGLESQNPNVKSMAVVLLRHLGPGAQSAAPALVAAARSIIRSSAGSAESREESFFRELAQTIVQILPAEEAAAILAEALTPGHSATQGIAAWTLGELGPRGSMAVPTLLQALADAEKPLRGMTRDGYAYSVIMSLQRIAPEARLSEPMADQVIEALARSLSFSDKYVRMVAASGLGKFANRASAALPRLRALCESMREPADVRKAASDAIGLITAGDRF
jgi:HEAT repeat protein